jgi:hypothetical protein
MIPLISVIEIRGVGTGGGHGGHVPPKFFQRTKSALFVQANVAVNSKLTSKVPFLFGNFQVFLKNLVKNVQFRYATTGKFFLPPSPSPTSLRKFF